MSSGEKVALLFVMIMSLLLTWRVAWALFTRAKRQDSLDDGSSL